MANTTIYNLPALNTVDSTSLFPLSSNVTATPTTYQASIGNIGNAITGNLRLTGDNITSTNNTINISADSNVWNFNANGNLTLPGLYGAQLIVNQLGGPGLFTGGATAQPSLNYGDLSNVFVGDNIVLTTDSGNNTWTFETTGYLQVPSNASQPGPGTIAAANGYPTILAYGSGGGMGIHGGPELDWMDADDPANNFGNASVLRNTMYLNGGGLYIGINENNVVGNVAPNWLFDPEGNLTLPDGTILQNGGGIQYPASEDYEWDLHSSDGNVYIGSVGDMAYIDTYSPNIGVRLRTNDINDWIFDPSGNLTLPNIASPSINYANGSPYGGSGNANTGNVTFNDQVVIGTGTDNGAGGLYLAPGTNSTANLQYLRVRGGDYPTHIHLDTGNNAYYDQYFGDDYKFIMLSSSGNILIRTNDLVGNTAQWDFGTDGNLTLPNIANPSINYANGSPYGGSGNANTGNVTFDNVNVIGTGNLKLQPDPANSGSYLDIFLTSGPDLHLVASQSANLILGKDDQSNVMTSWNGNVYIQAWDQNTGAPNIWIFDGTGNITAPGYIVLDAGTDGNIDSTGNINIISNVSTWTFGSDGEFYLPTGGRIGATKGGTMLDGGNGSLASLTSFYSNGFYSACFTAQTDGSAYITTYPGSGSNVWQFGVDGNTTFPSDGNVNLGNVIQAYHANFGLSAFIGNGSANIFLNYDGSGNFSGNLTSANANLGNLATANYVNVASNVVTSNLSVNLDFSGNTANFTGNITAINANLGNLATANYINVASNVVTNNLTINLDFSGNTANFTGNITAINANLGNIATANYINVASNVVTSNLSVNLDFSGNTANFTGNITAINANLGNIAIANYFSTSGTGGDITLTNGNISGANVITANTFVGNGSQLTDITASVPSQTILPTIQSITAIPMLTGYLSGGEGGVEVTVANVIPVTEFGVIVTAGTVSQKYATGSLGNAPGTANITFTTAQNGTQFTVFAYVTSNAGTYYSNAVTGTSGICLLAGTQIALSDGSHKAIEDITYTDTLLSWDFDRGCYAETTALWIKYSETGSQYNLLTFSDGTTLRTFDQHRIFNKQAGAFTYPMTDATPIGTVTVNEYGQEITLTNKQVIQDTIEYYNVITDYHMNLFSDSVLTSCRFNNIYPITDMKFVKDARTLRTRDEFENVPDRFFNGLRLAEQTTDIETVEWYVNRLLSSEMSTHAELAV